MPFWVLFVSQTLASSSQTKIPSELLLTMYIRQVHEQSAELGSVAGNVFWQCFKPASLHMQTEM